MSHSQPENAYKFSLLKLSSLDPLERRQLISRVAELALHDAEHALEAKDRVSAGRLVNSCCDALRSEDKHLGKTKLKEMKSILERMEAAKAALHGSRPTRIRVPAARAADEPVHDPN